MRLHKILIVGLITALSFSVGTAQPPTTKPTGSNELFQKVQAVYTSQLGVREATGRNDGRAVEMYLYSVGIAKGNPWCAAFVKWSFDRAGVKTNITAWSPTAFNRTNPVLFQNRFTQQPRAGDVFVLWFPKLKRIAHTGFFDRQINNSVFETVEGNTNEAGSREGDGVYRKKRSYRATYAISRWI